MTAVDGWAAARGATGGMLYIEAVVGALALQVLVAVAALSSKPRARMA